MLKHKGLKHKNMELAYREYGQKGQRALVLLHGLFGCSDNWVKFAKAWASQGYHCIVPDLRNQGDSPHSDEFSFELMCQDVRKLLEKFNHTKFDILGHSMGGNVAVKMAMDFSDMVRRLIVVDVAPKSYAQSKSKQFNYHTKVLEALKNLDLTKFASLNQIDEFLKRFSDKESYRKFMLNNIKRVNSQFQWRPNLNAHSLMVNAVKSFEKITAPVKIPTLFLKGENSDFIKEEDVSMIQENFPNSELKVVPNAKHWLHAQQPDFFMDAVSKFLNINKK